jgi:hypothetical protein
MARPSSISMEAISMIAGDGLDSVVELEAGEVDIAGRSTLIERSEQHPALEDEAVAVARPAEPVEEPFERVQREVLVDGSTVGVGPRSKVEERPAVDGRSRGARHRRICNAARMGWAALGPILTARASSCEG